MKQLFSFLILFALATSTSFSQQAFRPPTFIYKISTEEVKEIYKRDYKNNLEFQKKFLHTFIDSFSTKIYSKEEALKGYYLYISVAKDYYRQGYLSSSIRSFQDISIQPIQNNKGGKLQLLDTLQQPINTAQVFLKKKKLTYDEMAQGYQLPAKTKRGILTILWENDTIIYHLSQYKHRSRHQSIGWFSNWGNRRFYFKQSKNKGYIVINQPIYRPLDTAKIKVYIANSKGKPHNKPVEITIYDRDIRFARRFNRYKPIAKKILRPNDDGNFTSDFVLGDSLKIDTRYFVYILKPSDKKRKTLYFSGSFSLEDYELDKVTFNLSSTKSDYEPKDKIILNASGKDQNGNFIPDGTMRLSLYNNHINDFYQNKIYIPDTLWTQTLDLKSNDITRVIIPKSIIPAVKMQVLAIAEFYDASGEYQTKQVNFTVDNYTKLIDIQLDSNMISARYLEEGNQKDTIATLITYVKNIARPSYQLPDYSDQIITRSVKLPFSEPINPYYSQYQFKIGDYSKVFDFRKESANVNANGVNEKDSVNIQLNNPRRLPVIYAIYKGKKRILEGKTSKTSWTYRASNDKETFSILYQYPWKGSFQADEQHFSYAKDRLHITIDQASQVLPSASVPVKISIKDQDGNPVSAANVTALATNSTFDGGPFYDISNKNRFSKNKNTNTYTYYFKDFTKNQQSLRLTKNWYKRMNLDQDLYFRVRFPAQGMLFEYTEIKDSAYQNTAQFAPYIVKNGKLEPIYLIYVNNQLQYYSGAHQSKAYSFKGIQGKNEITIRTKDKEYIIKEVELKNGQKLELSLDEHHYIQHPHSKKIQIKPMPEEFTKAEKKLLYQTILVYEPKTYRTIYLWQSPDDVHTIDGNSYSPYMIGPFENGKPINMVVQDDYEKSFKFESGFRYEIEETRERLYKLQKWNFPFFNTTKRVGGIVKTTNAIERYSDFRRKLLQKASPSSASSKARYKFEGILVNPSNLIFWMQNDSLVQLTNALGVNYKMPAGDYTLLFYLSDSFYISHDITLRANNLFYETFEDKGIIEQIQLDTNLVQFKQIVQRFIYKNEQLPEEQINLYSHKNNEIYKTLNPYRGSVILGLSGGVYDLYQYENTQIEAVTVGARKKSIPQVFLRTRPATGSWKYEDSKQGGFETKKEQNGNLIENGILNVDYDSDDEDNFNTEAYLVGNYSNQQNIIRSEFRDYAYWQPNLTTDQNGDTYFIAHFPDDITNWKTMVIGMDRKTRSGIGYTETKAFKSVMGQLSIPRFLVEGDEVTIIGKALNFTNDTFDIKTVFKQNDQLIISKSQQLSNSIIETANITASTPTDSLKLLYQLTSKEFGDGEERVIPIFEKGVGETVGLFWLLDKDTSFVFNKNDNYGNIQVSVQSSALDVLIKDIEYLKNYPFYCNEQTASRLIGLLLEKQVKAHLDEPFKSERKIDQAIKKLYTTQNLDGSWGWWKDGKGSGWITAYVLKALYQAEQAGEIQRVPKFTNGIRFLVNNYYSFPASTRLFVMDIMVMMDIKSDFNTKIDEFLKEQPSVSLHQQMVLIKAKQSVEGNSYSLTDLDKLMKKTTFGGYYWGEDGYFCLPVGRQRCDNSVYLTITAYGIYKKAGREDICKGIRRFFLEKRTHNGWHNTFESAQILNIVLPEVLKDDAELTDNSMTINGKKVNLTDKAFQETYTDNQISIKKTGNAPIYVTAYQQFHNPEPKAKSDIFEVKTFFSQGKVDRQSLVNFQSLLNRNQSTILTTTVQVKQSADYVMIEIPIPAGCSYEIKSRGFSGYEVHREHFKNKVVIFCEELPVGKHTFEVKLETRYSGSFTVNAAKVEQMYFPVFYGRNENKKIKIN